MPYSINKRGDRYCVIKDTDGSIVTCHDTRSGAEAQIRALYANESKSLVFKAHNRRYMFLLSSNAYTDREDEIVRQTALELYVKQFKPNAHKLWHRGNPIGQIVAAQNIGPFLLEVSRELPDATIDISGDDEPPMPVTIKQVWNYAERNPGLFGASIGFKYLKGDEQDGVYDAILKEETSTLPLSEAANAITLSTVIGGKPMSEAQKTNRRNLWQSIVGKPVSDQLSAAMEALQASLDAAGINRKEFSGQKNKALMEELAQQIDDLLAGITDNPPEELRNQIIATVMGAMADTGAASEPAPDEPPIAEMADGQDEENKLPEQVMELTAAVKAMVEERQASDEEWKEFIPAFIQVTSVVKEFAPLVGKIKDLEALEARMKSIEANQKMRPRAASQAVETEIEDQATRERLQAGTKGQKKTVLGIPVKE
jgi:hypothetical protein